jgi:nitroreductase / dihydropteridine reductase
MQLLQALHWRYAAKRMNGKAVAETQLQSILDAISLAPSSFGLQPYSILVISNTELLAKIQPIANMQPQIIEGSSLLVFAAWDNITQLRIDTYIKEIASTRKVTEESLGPLKEMIVPQLNNSEADNFNWNAKQAYIALGVGLVAAAFEQVDSTPMEGFDHDKLDVLLQLKEQGLKSVVLLALGHRDENNDYLVKLKKVRREKEKLFVML